MSLILLEGSVIYRCQNIVCQIFHAPGEEIAVKCIAKENAYGVIRSSKRYANIGSMNPGPITPVSVVMSWARIENVLIAVVL